MRYLNPLPVRHVARMLCDIFALSLISPVEGRKVLVGVDGFILKKVYGIMIRKYNN